jgi:cell division protein ZapA (FtsZ GTPase activity inhibitor)
MVFMQKNLKISIFGKTYLISTDENSEVVMEAAGVIDRLMKTKSEHMPLQGEGRLAVIVALELATDLAKKMQEIKQWETKILELNQTLDVIT